MHETNDVIKERTIRNQYYRGNIGFPSGSSTGLPTCNDLLRSIIWYANYIGRDRLPVNFKRPPQRGYTVLKCRFNPWTIRTSIRTMVAENFSPNFRKMHSCNRETGRKSGWHLSLLTCFHFKRNDSWVF